MASITHTTVAVGSDAGNGEIRKAQWNEDHTLVGIPYVFAQSAVAASVGAVTTETILATISFSGGEIGPNGSVKVLATWSFTNNANSKTCKIRLGGIAGSQLHSTSPTTNVTFSTEKTFINENSESAQKGDSPPFWFGTPQVSTDSKFTSTVNTASAWDLVITGTKANSADTLTLELYQVIVTYGA